MTRERDISYIAKHYGWKKQRVVLVEELSELIQSICKFERAETDKETLSARAHILEELADVEIMLEQLKFILDLNDDAVNLMINAKVDRQLHRIKTEKEN